MTKPRRRSLEVTCIYKVRDAQRAHDLAWQTFTGAADRTRMTEYLNEWQTAENKVARCRLMRKAASSVAIRRSRHGLMLAAARHGVDAYALLDWETNSPEQLANDTSPLDEIVSGLTDSSDLETQASRSRQTVNDSGPNAPPTLTEVHHD
jgi:acyl-homoserine lactone acylase PvdQ